ncbi:MAG: hypothetical protein NVS1B10_08230 [Candidatus Saccharimonadales bacterium]
MNHESWRERYNPNVQQPTTNTECEQLLREQYAIWKFSQEQEEPHDLRQAMCNIDYLLGQYVVSTEFEV